MITSKGSNGSKRLRRILISALSFVLALAIAVPAFAATITITNTEEGETYYVFKVLDATVDENDNTKVNYYTEDITIARLLAEYDYTITPDPDEYSDAGTRYYVSWSDDAESTASVAKATQLTEELYERYSSDVNHSELIALLGNYVDEFTVASGETTVSSRDDLGLGYYFVTSSLGSLCMLDTVNTNVNIEEKNSAPTVEKTVSVSDNVDGNDAVSAQIGTTVYFTVEVDAPANTESLELTDILSKGLTLDEGSFRISTSDGVYTNVTPSVDSIESNSDGSTTVTIDLVEYLNDSENITITITYSAMINGDAVATTETNEATITYGENSSSVKSEVSMPNYSAIIYKVDGDTKVSDGNYSTSLTGAVFNLFDADYNQLYVVPMTGDDEDNYRLATSADESGAITDIEVTNSDGSVIIYGLEAGTYYLKEIKAPDGYNLLGDYIELDLANGEYTTNSDYDPENNTIGYSITEYIENYEGSLLPASGGIGTTIIYIVGTLLVVGAGAALYVRHRKA